MQSTTETLTFSIALWPEQFIQPHMHQDRIVLEVNLVILVKVSGHGIRQQDLDAVYDPFFTSKTVGAGLGLTMVHQIVMNHHGEIKITSQSGKGTTVRIQLPIYMP